LKERTDKVRNFYPVAAPLRSALESKNNPYFSVMKKLCVAIMGVLLTSTSFSQIANDFMVGGAVDLIKSNQNGYFGRVQGGIEANYYLSKKFSGTTGAEYWSERNEFSFVVGGRWFPVPEAFVRFRGLIGANDFSLGGGWAKPLKENWRFEAMGDIYGRGHIAIRAGIAYVFKSE
jgi:hypothetical protein